MNSITIYIKIFAHIYTVQNSSVMKWKENIVSLLFFCFFFHAFFFSFILFSFARKKREKKRRKKKCTCHVYLRKWLAISPIALALDGNSGSPLNLWKIFAGGVLSMVVSRFNLPRCGIPSTMLLTSF